LALAAAGGRLETHVFIDERSASFAALGCARATGKPAVLVCTSGTATANFFPAVQEAHHGRVPLLVLTADRPPELRHTGANQTIDQVKLYGDAVRWFVEVGVPDEATPPSYWRSLAGRAWARAVGSPPGPVHLNLSFREPLVGAPDDPLPEPYPGRADGAPWTRVDAGPAVLDGRKLEHLAERLGRAGRGAIVAGAGLDDGGGLVRLAERLGWPLLADPLSNARYGSSAISTYDGLLRVETFADSHTPDLVVRAGALGISKSLKSFVAGAPEQILIDPDGWWLDPDRSVNEVVTAGTSDLADALCDILPPSPSSEWLEDWLAAEGRARSALDEALSQGSLTEPRVARDLIAAISEGSDLVVAASMPFRDVEAFGAPRSGIRFLGNRGANGIDGFIGTCVGAATTSGRPTFALSGDLSLLHDQDALIGARERKVDLTIVVIDNDGGGIFSFLPQAALPEHFEKVFGTPHGLDLADLARLYGVNHERIESPGDLQSSARRAPQGVTIVEVRTDRADNVEVHRRLNHAIRATVSSPDP
jgi:2-succinyl-5-enolpyruvyl-6-hydroxy-3-cyclohexene-1-carboxylate synthase